MVCVLRVRVVWPFPLPPWPWPVSELAFEAFPVDRLPVAPVTMQAPSLSRQVRSLRDLQSPPETPLLRWSLLHSSVPTPKCRPTRPFLGPPLLSFTLNTPPPVPLAASTPGRRCRLPSVQRYQPPDLVPSSWFLTTSTACSASRSSGLLHPETGRGVRRVSNSRHPSPLLRR